MQLCRCILRCCSYLMAALRQLSVLIIHLRNYWDSFAAALTNLKYGNMNFTKTSFLILHLHFDLVLQLGPFSALSSATIASSLRLFGHQWSHCYSQVIELEALLLS